MASRQESGKLKQNLSMFCFGLSPLASVLRWFVFDSCFMFGSFCFVLEWKKDKDTKVKTQEINAARDLLSGRLHREDRDKKRQEKQEEHWRRHERDARESDERSSKRKSPFVDDECDVSGNDSGDEGGEGGCEESLPKEKPYVWKRASSNDWNKHKQAQQEEKAKSKAIYQAFMERQKELQKKPESADDMKKKIHYPFTGKMRPVGWNCSCVDCKK